MDLTELTFVRIFNKQKKRKGRKRYELIFLHKNLQSTIAVSKPVSRGVQFPPKTLKSKIENRFKFSHASSEYRRKEREKEGDVHERKREKKTKGTINDRPGPAY